MSICPSSIGLACGLFAIVCGPRADAQDQNSKKYNELWSDHAFDTLRGKIQFDSDKKPSFKMLTSTERFPARDKPLGDLALEKCRAVWALVYSMPPPNASPLIHGVECEQDALIAELYNGKITFGAFNVGIDRLPGKLAEALSGISRSSETRTSSNATGTEKATQKSSLMNETRWAL